MTITTETEKPYVDRLIGDVEITVDVPEDVQRFYREWISELESGNRKQVKTTLKNRDGNCCLGVGAEVLVDDDHADLRERAGHLTIEVLPNVLHLWADGNRDSFCGSTKSWPADLERESQLEALGLSQTRLYEANDGKNRTFAQIAQGLRYALRGDVDTARAILRAGVEV